MSDGLVQSDKDDNEYWIKDKNPITNRFISVGGGGTMCTSFIQSNRLAIETRFDTSEPEHNPIFTAGFQQVTFNENLPNQELCGVL